MKEQNRVLEKDLNKVESSNLKESEFKILVIKMLNELRGRVEKLSENFNKEIENIKMEMENIKGNQSEMKKTGSEMKSIQEGINRMDDAKDRIASIEVEVVEDTQSEWQWEKRIQKNEDYLRSLWDSIKYDNIWIIGALEEEREQGVKNLFEEIMMENFLSLVKKIDVQPQEAQRVPQKGELKEAHTKTHHNSNAKG